MTVTESYAADTSRTFTVPRVDISAFVNDGPDEEKQAAAQAFDEACRTVGFVQVVGHGISDEVIEGLKESIDAFFFQDLEAKKQWKLPPKINRGYSPPKSERLSLSAGVEAANKMNDFFEAYNIGTERSDYPELDLPERIYQANQWPDVAGFEEKVSAYWNEAGRVARTLTKVMATGLGLEEDWFHHVTDHSLDTMRMVNYALDEGTDVQLDGDLRGMGEHTDFGIVTVLWADRVEGLQVLSPWGTWEDVMPDPGALLVNLGDAAAAFTNDVYRSTLHRVAPPVVDGKIRRRRSAAFFHDGNADAVIEPIPEVIEEGTEVNYGPISVWDHIKAKLSGSRGGKLNEKAGSEALRIAAAAGKTGQ